MNIFPPSEYTKVYTGPHTVVLYIKNILDDAGISYIVRNDGESARLAGFGTSYVSEVAIIVKNEDVDQAKQLIDEAVSKMDEA